MADIEKTIKALKDWKNDPLAMNAEIDPCLVDDALSVIESLQAENKIITENIIELDEQRGEFAMRLEKLRLQNERLKAERRWIPVADHLPEVDVWKSVNCWAAWFNEHANKMEVQKLRYVREMVRGKDICRWKSDCGLFHESVIAWMPIKPPQPPKEGDQG